jgi:hypothetical protein
MLISDLDTSLKAMLIGEATPGSALAGASISFAAPTQTWQGQGTGMQVDAYLYQILDNRELRSNQRNTIVNPDGSVTMQLSPARIECSYIITAWEKGSDVAGIDKEPAEHGLLSQILYVLWRNPTMPPKYLSGSIAGLPLPIIAAQTEDVAGKPDFWSALNTYVRPAITCRVTIEMDLNQNVVGPQATAIVTNVTPRGAMSGDLTAMISGWVRNAAAPLQIIPDTWIMLDSSLATCVSDLSGSFRISGIAPGPHTLTARAVGFAQGVQTFRVPDPSGIYDISLTPL